MGLAVGFVRARCRSVTLAEPALGAPLPSTQRQGLPESPRIARTRIDFDPDDAARDRITHSHMRTAAVRKATPGDRHGLITAIRPLFNTQVLACLRDRADNVIPCRRWGGRIVWGVANPDGQCSHNDEPTDCEHRHCAEKRTSPEVRRGHGRILPDPHSFGVGHA